MAARPAAALCRTGHVATRRGRRDSDPVGRRPARLGRRPGDAPRGVRGAGPFHSRRCRARRRGRNAVLCRVEPPGKRARGAPPRNGCGPGATGRLASRTVAPHDRCAVGHAEGRRRLPPARPRLSRRTARLHAGRLRRARPADAAASRPTDRRPRRPHRERRLARPRRGGGESGHGRRGRKSRLCHLHQRLDRHAEGCHGRAPQRAQPRGQPGRRNGHRAGRPDVAVRLAQLRRSGRGVLPDPAVGRDTGVARQGPRPDRAGAARVLRAIRRDRHAHARRGLAHGGRRPACARRRPAPRRCAC